MSEKPDDLIRFEKYLAAHFAALGGSHKIELVWWVDHKTGRQFVWRPSGIEILSSAPHIPAPWGHA